MKIKTAHLLSAGFLLLFLPCAMFLLFWLRPTVGIPAFLLLGAGLFCALRFLRRTCGDRTLELSRGVLALVLFVPLLWAVCSGQGAFVPQKWDMIWRNAVFRDLITHDWPVLYNSGQYALVYYIGHWLIPAGLGKILLPVLGLDAVWRIANIALLLWTCLHLWVTLLLCLAALGSAKIKDAAVVLAVFIFFSGMDYVGLILVHGLPLKQHQLAHIEWWQAPFQYSSMTTQLGWVFNQSVPAWLAVMLYISLRKRVTLFAQILAFMLLSAPFPAVGLAVFMTADGFRLFFQAIRTHRVFSFFRDVFSIPNIVSAAVLLPVIYLYYSSNIAVQNMSTTMPESMAGDMQFFWYLGFLRSKLPLFWIIEFGALACFLGMIYRRRFLFITAAVSLLIIPCFINRSWDLVMRVSIPGLFVLMFLTIRLLTRDVRLMPRKGKILRMPRCGLPACAAVFILLAGSMTAVTEFAATFRETKKYDMFTLDNADSPNPNFMAGNFRETPFFRLLAAKKQE